MSAKFDKCPICGYSVGYEDSAGGNKGSYVAMCMKGHTIVDLGSSNGLICKNEFQAAKGWNKMVRRYLKDNEKL